MQLTTIKQTITVCTLVMIFLTLTAIRCGAEQEFTTLEVVNVYDSTEQLKVTYPEHFQNIDKIQIRDNNIQFLERRTNTIRTQSQSQHIGFEFIEPLSEVELWWSHNCHRK